MLINVEGTLKEIKHIFKDLDSNLFMDLFYEVPNEQAHNHEKVTMAFYHGKSDQKIVTYELSTLDGKTIEIPLLRSVQIKVGKSVIVYGRTFDIFKNKKESHGSVAPEEISVNSIITFLDREVE